MEGFLKMAGRQNRIQQPKINDVVGYLTKQLIHEDNIRE
jgi:hypothetical protein